MGALAGMLLCARGRALLVTVSDECCVHVRSKLTWISSSDRLSSTHSLRCAALR